MKECALVDSQMDQCHKPTRSYENDELLLTNDTESGKIGPQKLENNCSYCFLSA